MTGKYYNYFIFKLVFHNTQTLLLLFPTIVLALLLQILFKNPDQVISNDMSIEKGLVIFYISLILIFILAYKKALEKYSNTFLSIKYSNFNLSSFNLFKEQDKKLFHKHVIDAIISKDLNLKKFVKQFENSPKYQRILLNELDSKSFKTLLLSELDYHRFEYEVSHGFKKSGWIRDFLNYRSSFEKAFFITSKSASDSSILNNMSDIQEAIVTNINIIDGCVQVNSQGLKESILKINKATTEVNLKYRIILNPKITQKQFAQILESYVSENLSNFKTVRFSAYFTGFLEYNKANYNCQNIFKPYTVDMNENQIKEFIAILRHFVQKNVILGNDVNSDSKLAEIIEILVENCLLSEKKLSSNFSEKYAYIFTLDKEVIKKLNSTIYKYFPETKKSF